MAGRTSISSTIAPNRFAVAIAHGPATPTPVTSTRAGAIVPPLSSSSAWRGWRTGQRRRSPRLWLSEIGLERQHRPSPGRGKCAAIIHVARPPRLGWQSPRSRMRTAVRREQGRHHSASFSQTAFGGLLGSCAAGDIGIGQRIFSVGRYAPSPRQMAISQCERQPRHAGLPPRRAPGFSVFDGFRESRRLICTICRFLGTRLFPSSPLTRLPRGSGR